MSKKCVLRDRSCTDCGQCMLCDLDPTKVCDNCCKCLGDADYSGIEIDDIILNIEERKQFHKPTNKSKHR